MNHYHIFLPDYTAGENAYDALGEICLPYGKKAVVIGGRRAMTAAGNQLRIQAEKAGIRLLDFLWYGGQCSYEAVEMLQTQSAVIEADMLFALGGGKALDTVKALANTIQKPVFTFPTIASNCAACTSVSIMYHPDGSFFKPFFFEKPPAHAFIDLSIIAKSPSVYLWAGMGDTYAKYFESTISSRGETLNHYLSLGVTISSMCLQPILSFGARALADNKSSLVTPALEQVVLSIIVSTALSSILLTKEQIIDYNTGLGHAVFYALTSYAEIEENHLHGELVSYGILILLLVDNNREMFFRLYDFNRKTGLPTCLRDIGLDLKQLPQIISKILQMKDIEHNPYPITEAMLTQAFHTLEDLSRQHL